MSLPSVTIHPVASASTFARRALARSPLRRSAITSVAALAFGCTSDGIDLGGGALAQPLERGARCQNSTIVEGNVLVTNQQELEDLEGCEEIRGDFTIRMFAEAELTPLRALQVVEGGFLIGRTLFATSPEEEEEQDSQTLEEIRLAEQALRGTWLESLEGLESLERVGGLLLSDTAVSDLSPLAQLREFGGAGGSPEGVIDSGDLGIQGNPLLRDLTGLERARGVIEVGIGFNGALESLDGLTPESELTLLSIFEEPALTDIDAFSAITRVGALTLVGVGVTQLDALSSLHTVEGAISITNNPDLVNVNGLGNVQQATSLEVVNNAKLEKLPSFQSYFVAPETIVIGDNPELEALTFDFFQASTDGFFVGSLIEFSTGGVLIRNNAALRSVVFPPNPIEGLGVKAMQVVAFELNPSLAELDFGGLERADLFVILQNPALARVNLGVLAKVDTLQITDNPSLDTSVFDPVRTFERIEAGNAPSARP
jgi:hypothetical protein